MVWDLTRKEWESDRGSYERKNSHCFDKIKVTFVESQKRTHSACAEQCRAGGQATELIERKSLKLILTGPKPGA